jgi:hypothetical protein
MSDDTDQLGSDDDDGSPHVTLKRSDIRRLEKAAREGSAAQVELAQVKRDMAFRDAGINPSSDPRLQYFVKGYEGEATVEAIKTAAIEAGFLKAQQEAAGATGAPDPSGGGPSPAELEAIRRMNGATSAPQAPDVSMDAAFHTALAAAQSPAEIMQVVARFGVPTPGMD